MANELQYADVTGLTLYSLLLRQSDHQIYSTTVPGFEAILSGHWANYSITLTEATGTGLYAGDMPSMSAGLYTVLVYSQAGAQPATTDSIFGQSEGYWTGTSWTSFSRLDMTQAVPTSNTAETVGDALNAARAQAFGNWVLNESTNVLTLYANDGTTVVHTFLLDSSTSPTARTSQ